MAAPTEGPTVRAHVDELLERSAAAVATARAKLQGRLKLSEREALWRELAGAIAALETVRIWLARGAPTKG